MRMSIPSHPIFPLMAVDICRILLPSSPTPPQPTLPKLNNISNTTLFTKRSLILSAFQICYSSSVLAETPLPSTSPTSSSYFLSGIANTRSWFQFYGDGFAIRVPPNFQDIMEPEDDNVGLALYGDKAKPKTYAARFASPDGSEVVSVVIRPSNQLKITFLEAKDIADLGSLKETAKIFVPGGATLYSARSIKIKEDESYRNYYFYEFGMDEQHVALVAAVSSGKAIIAGAAAPENRWEKDGVHLRSAAVSLTLL
ncbi:Mog1/PsbP/DUF1795-like photosystem II reaction center PsbP family protein [Striga hermonthica]|uniref:Mog1/PsbP/DUF1795-like photosystem II reaction center PsbP family protein n=1 Tax=Striga hermonthica TaxID=68872 RepID=A0A9N7MZZ8_STRHE|nr:Mog1/PsbP/DUF1795-like photosystem II reaction center PsbP family protein [Striga hermonthica]